MVTGLFVLLSGFSYGVDELYYGEMFLVRIEHYVSVHFCSCCSDAVVCCAVGVGVLLLYSVEVGLLFCVSWWRLFGFLVWGRVVVLVRSLV